MAITLLLNQMFVPAIAVASIVVGGGLFIQQIFFKNKVFGESSQFFIVAEVEIDGNQASGDMYEDVAQKPVPTDASQGGESSSAAAPVVPKQKIRKYECKLSYGLKESTKCKIIKFTHNSTKKYSLFSELPHKGHDHLQESSIPIDSLQAKAISSDLKEANKYVLVQVPESTVKKIDWSKTPTTQKITVHPIGRTERFGTLKPLFIVNGTGFSGKTKHAFVLPSEFDDPNHVVSQTEPTKTDPEPIKQISIESGKYKCSFVSDPKDGDLKTCTIKESLSTSTYVSSSSEATSIDKEKFYLVTFDEEYEMSKLSNYSFFYIQTTDLDGSLETTPKKVTFNSPMTAILNETSGHEHAFIMTNIISA